MKLSKFLIFSIEALSVLATATVLDFTASKLPEGVKLYTLKEKSLGDSREVKLYTSEAEDGFKSVLEGSLKVWGDDKKYSCEYTKVYSTEGKAEALKLAFHLKGSAITRTNTKHSFLVKKDGKWTVVDRRAFWDSVRSTFVFNYAHESYEHDEKFESYRIMEFVAESPDFVKDYRETKLPSPTFPRVLSAESEKAKPMTELYRSSDKTGEKAKTHRRTKGPVSSDSAHPLIELQRLSDKRLEEKYEAIEAKKRESENAPIFTELHRSSGDVMDMKYKTAPAKAVKPKAAKPKAAKPKAAKPEPAEKYTGPGPVSELLRSSDHTMEIQYKPEVVVATPGKNEGPMTELFRSADHSLKMENKPKAEDKNEVQGEGPMTELLRSSDNTMEINVPKLRRQEYIPPVKGDSNSDSDTSSFLTSSLLLPAILMIFYSAA